MKPKILYEDEAIIVVDKPSGMVVDQVAAQTGAILVHRLDRDTSGVMVLAKNASAEGNLKKQFEERKVNKRYMALVHGELTQDRGLITSPVQRYPKDKPRSAITEWQVIQRLTYRVSPCTLLEVMPYTGRTHQIRKHLKSIGHPIVADPIYGYRKKLKADLSFCPRLFLHATYLEFTHPLTSQKIQFQAELPGQLQKVVDFLVKRSGRLGERMWVKDMQKVRSTNCIFLVT